MLRRPYATAYAVGPDGRYLEVGDRPARPSYEPPEQERAQDTGVPMGVSEYESWLRITVSNARGRVPRGARHAMDRARISEGIDTLQDASLSDEGQLMPKLQ